MTWAALFQLCWSIRRNPASLRASHWPAFSPEPTHPGDTLLPPADCFPYTAAAFTHSSVEHQGGASVWILASLDTDMLAVPDPSNSTHVRAVGSGLGHGTTPRRVLHRLPLLPAAPTRKYGTL